MGGQQESPAKPNYLVDDHLEVTGRQRQELQGEKCLLRSLPSVNQV